MYNNHIIGAITASEGYEYTGSFARLQCVSGSKHIGGITNDVIFDRIEFGKFTLPQSSQSPANSQINEYTHSLSQTLADSNHYSSQDPNIQGPINRFKLKRGRVLAYFTNKTIISTEPA